jgi:DNA primase
MTPVEQIKSRLSIVDVVGSYIKLEKAGSSFKALCPFHNEKSASFNVSPSRDAYYCFGCNRGGDIFSFVEEIEGVDFMGALRLLADRAGVELVHELHESKSEREHLFALMEEATLFYERKLLTSDAVKEYLVDRGLSEATIRSFRIGFAPLEWRSVYDHLIEKKFTADEIEKAGLIKPVEGKEPYDRFRGRVMFPIFDANGRVVAFSGRVFGEQKNKDGSDVAKYINSPETLLFDKSSIMFGYDRAKRTIRSQNFTILVEGQMDLIMSHQSGTENTVAVSGTALTEKHLTLLKRLSDNLVFAFDADEAGLRATGRAFRMALALGMGVRVVAIPEGKDPADFIKAHPSEWAGVIANSSHIIDFYLNILSARSADDLDFRKKVESDVLPLVLEMRSKIEQAHYIIEIARKLRVPEQSVWEEVKRLQLAGEIVRPRDRHEERVESYVSAPIKNRRQVAEEEIIGILLWQEGHSEPALDVATARVEYLARVGAHAITPHVVEDAEHPTLIMRMENKYDHGPGLRRLLDELLDTVEEEILKERQVDLLRRISDAELRGAKDETKELLQTYQSITPQIIALEDRRVMRKET